MSYNICFFIVTIIAIYFLFIYHHTETFEINEIIDTDKDGDGYKIPRVVHQTYPGNSDDPLPKKVKENIKYIQDMNPLWEHKLYRDDEIEAFIQHNYSERTLEIYHKIKKEYGPARSDFFRYLLIYKVGGVYLDIKSATNKPLDDIIHKNDSYILSHWGNSMWSDYLNYPDGELQQWHVISIAKHPFLKEVIKKVKKKILKYNPARDGVGKLGVLKVTGPLIYSQAIIPMLKNHPHRIFSSHDKAGLVYDNIGEYEKLFKKHYTELLTPIIDPKKKRKHKEDDEPIDNYKKLDDSDTYYHYDKYN